jgi:hypothetical protein
MEQSFRAQLQNVQSARGDGFFSKSVQKVNTKLRDILRFDSFYSIHIIRDA